MTKLNNILYTGTAHQQKLDEDISSSLGRLEKISRKIGKRITLVTTKGRSTGKKGYDQNIWYKVKGVEIMRAPADSYEHGLIRPHWQIREIGENGNGHPATTDEKIKYNLNHADLVILIQFYSSTMSKIFKFLMAETKGLEPSTSGVTGQRSKPTELRLRQVAIKPKLILPITILTM